MLQSQPFVLTRSAQSSLGASPALSFGSMAIENRRKKKAWFAEQETNYAKALDLARQAEVDGTITPGLEMFLNKERALEQAEAEKKARPGLWTRIKKTAFNGLSLEETKRPSAGVVGSGASTQHLETRTAQGKTATQVAQDMSVQAAHDSRILESRGPSSKGGPLDRLGEQTASSLASSTQSWLDWVGRR